MRFLIFLALLGAAFAVPRTVNRIVGGEVTTVENYPYMANMQNAFLGTWVFGCGGSLLTNTVVLTAAHCVLGDRASDWRVRLGTSSQLTGGTVHPVSQIIIHEHYNTPHIITPSDNDIAIMRLSVPAVYSHLVRAARIAGPNYNPPDGAVVTAIGWGSTASGGPLSEQLRHVNVNVINQELCAARYAYLKMQPGYELWPDISDGMLCAGILDVGGKDACHGDSGGPLAHEGDILVGVTSWGFGCADAVYPGVNARISHYSDWIVANA